MQRVEPKQLDALFEPPPKQPSTSRLPGGEAIADTDHDRRLRQDRPAHREDRRRRARRRLGQAAAADARRRRRPHRNVFVRHRGGLQARRPGRQAHRAGRQPRAAQDEVRRQRRHGAGGEPRRRKATSGALSARTLSPARSRACASSNAREQWHARRPHAQWRARLARLQLAPFRPRLLDSLRGYDRARFFEDSAPASQSASSRCRWRWRSRSPSGQARAGLFTAIIAGFLISRSAARSVQIGGPAGAFIVIVYGIVERYGLANLLIATCCAGVLLFVMGLLRLGALVRYMPVSIVIGFTNGIAVLIALSQLKDLLGLADRQGCRPTSSRRSRADRAAPATTSIRTRWRSARPASSRLFVWPRLFVAAQRCPRRARTARCAPRACRGRSSRWSRSPSSWRCSTLPVETIGTRFGGIPQSLPALALPAF